MNEIRLIKQLRNGSKSLQELTKDLQLNPQTIRRISDDLEDLNIIRKTRRNRYVYYHLMPEFYRRIPRFRTRGITTKIYIANAYEAIRDYIPGMETTFIKAAREEYNTLMRLLIAGAQYQNTKETVSKDSEAYKKQVKLQEAAVRDARIKLKKAIQDVEYNLRLMKAIEKDEEFWDLEALSNHFSAFVDDNGAIIPQVLTLSTLMEHPLAQQLTAQEID